VAVSRWWTSPWAVAALLFATWALWRTAKLARRDRTPQRSLEVVLDRNEATAERLTKLYEEGLGLHDEIDVYDRDRQAYVADHGQDANERILEWLGETSRLLCKSDLAEHADQLVAKIPPAPASDDRQLPSGPNDMHRRVDVFLDRLALTLHEVYRLKVAPRERGESSTRAK
jgi:hypothetical protein